MKEPNSLFLQAIRALNSVSGSSYSEVKARTSYLGLNAIQILQEKVKGNPEILRELCKPEEYSEKEWEEINIFLSDIQNDFSEEKLKYCENKLAINTHLQLIYLYKEVIYQFSNQSANESNSEKDFLSVYDKSLKLIRSCKILLSHPDFKPNRKYNDIKNIYHKTIDLHKRMVLKNSQLVQKIDDEKLYEIQIELAEMTLEFLRKLIKTSFADIHKAYLDEKKTLEALIDNFPRLKAAFGQDISMHMLIASYEGLEKYYRLIDDEENILRIRSKREMLDLRNKSTL